MYNMLPMIMKKRTFVPLQFGCCFRDGVVWLSIKAPLEELCAPLSTIVSAQHHVISAWQTTNPMPSRPLISFSYSLIPCSGNAARDRLIISALCLLKDLSVTQPQCHGPWPEFQKISRSTHFSIRMIRFKEEEMHHKQPTRRLTGHRSFR